MYRFAFFSQKASLVCAMTWAIMTTSTLHLVGGRLISYYNTVFYVVSCPNFQRNRKWKKEGLSPGIAKNGAFSTIFYLSLYTKPLYTTMSNIVTVGNIVSTKKIKGENYEQQILMVQYRTERDA